MATRTTPVDERPARPTAPGTSLEEGPDRLPPLEPGGQRDIRPRAGTHAELKARDKWMAWSAISLALVGALLLFAFCGRAVP